jgi:hypothetical protein
MPDMGRCGALGKRLALARDFAYRRAIKWSDA